jgi:hypothetical protein
MPLKEETLIVPTCFATLLNRMHVSFYKPLEEMAWAECSVDAGPFWIVQERRGRTNHIQEYACCRWRSEDRLHVATNCSLETARQYL